MKNKTKQNKKLQTKKIPSFPLSPQFDNLVSKENLKAIGWLYLETGETMNYWVANTYILSPFQDIPAYSLLLHICSRISLLFFFSFSLHIYHKEHFPLTSRAYPVPLRELLEWNTTHI